MAALKHETYQRAFKLWQKWTPCLVTYWMLDWLTKKIREAEFTK